MPGLTRSAIEKTLDQKLSAWQATVPFDIKDRVILTGGCIASLLLGEAVKDYDVYLDNQDTTYKLARYYVDKFNAAHPTKGDSGVSPYVKVDGNRIAIYVKSAGAIGEGSEDYSYFEESADSVGAEAYIEKSTTEVVEGEKFRPIFLSENAITLSNKVQIVIRFYGPPEEIHKNYDYIHATNYYYQGELHLNSAALESLLAKRLKYQGSLYPICSLFRMRKFMDRGWKISAGEITKMAFQISELDLTDPSVLKEQLIGVDAAYFAELIRLIHKWMEGNPGKPVDASYVIQLIDGLS